VAIKTLEHKIVFEKTNVPDVCAQGELKVRPPFGSIDQLPVTFIQGDFAPRFRASRK
jgi:hypothetical protein